MPATADEAIQLLHDGHLRFSNWTESCIAAHGSHSTPPALVVPCSALDLGIADTAGMAAKQAPFAILLGCSDARVPAETIFGLLRNNLFVIRVAGNVLSEECFGSIEYAVHNLAESVRVVLVLGHSNCGAVAATVDTFLNPWSYLEKVPSAALRSIVDRLLMPVRKAAHALETLWGETAPRQQGYRDALIQAAVSINAVQSAYSLRQVLTQEGHTAIKVVYGVFDLATHRIWSGSHTGKGGDWAGPVLTEAPATLAEFEQLALQLAIRAARRTAEKG